MTASINLLSANAATSFALFADPACEAAKVKVHNVQDVGEMLGAASTLSTHVAMWCVKHLKGFPQEVSKADETAIKAGLQKYKLALDTAKGLDIELVKIGEDRWQPMKEWLKTHASVEEVEGTVVFNCNGAAIMAPSPNKMAKMPQGRGTLHSFMAPRRKTVQTYVSNRYNIFISEASKLLAATEEEALYAKGKDVEGDARPVIAREIKIAKAFFAAMKDAKDEDWGTVTAATLDAACTAFWDTLGIEAPELDAKGNVIPATDKAA